MRGVLDFVDKVKVGGVTHLGEYKIGLGVV